MAANVTSRIEQVKQPRGGYVSLKSFNKLSFDDGVQLHDHENIGAGAVGTAVDNLTRLLIAPVDPRDRRQLSNLTQEEAFSIALKGAEKQNNDPFNPDFIEVDHLADARELAAQVTGLDDQSIICACKLSMYDACFRAGGIAYVPVDRMTPDAQTIENIRTMVKRTLTFYQQQGPVTAIGPCFPGGYTEVVTNGDADLVTLDILWDIKTSKKPPRTRDTLQVYMYYLMGRRSTEPAFRTVTSIGIFNPRLNIAWYRDVKSIPRDVREAVERDVIGYELG